MGKTRFVPSSNLSYSLNRRCAETNAVCLLEIKRLAFAVFSLSRLRTVSGTVLFGRSTVLTTFNYEKEFGPFLYFETQQSEPCPFSLVGMASSNGNWRELGSRPHLHLKLNCYANGANVFTSRHFLISILNGMTVH